MSETVTTTKPYRVASGEGLADVFAGYGCEILGPPLSLSDLP